MDDKFKVIAIRKHNSSEIQLDKVSKYISEGQLANKTAQQVEALVKEVFSKKDIKVDVFYGAVNPDTSDYIVIDKS